LDYRVQWDADFLAFLKKLERKKPVIFCGDLNVAHQEIDLAHPKANVGNHGFTPQERAGFGNFIKAPALLIRFVNFMTAAGITRGGA
jgi:exodeoxyribonuclease-3